MPLALNFFADGVSRRGNLASDGAVYFAGDQVTALPGWRGAAAQSAAEFEPAAGFAAGAVVAEADLSQTDVTAR